jgi:8-oxo-dGTP pyrophosphatase MutT (NUDIX family)
MIKPMSRWQQNCGTALYWLTWPGLWLYLRFGQRTRVLVVCDQQVLLVKGWLGDGKWSLPGGGLHRHEDPRQGVKRELLEETALDLPLAAFTFVANLTGHNHGLTFKYDLFVAEVAAALPVARQPREIAATNWQNHRQLTDEQITPATRVALRAWFNNSTGS